MRESTTRRLKLAESLVSRNKRKRRWKDKQVFFSSFVSVVVMCANSTTIREILLAAEQLGMVDSGEYVFFSIELSSR